MSKHELNTSFGNKKNSDEVEVTFSKPCIFSGKEKKIGDKLTVSKARKAILKDRGLVD